MTLARKGPARIETLVLDVLHPGKCRTLGAAWGETPVDLLVHLQPLRARLRPGSVVAAIPALTRGLLPALARGAGQVLIVTRAADAGAPAEAHAFDAALCTLVPHVQAEAGGRARISMLRIAGPAGRAVVDAGLGGLPGAGRGGIGMGARLSAGYLRPEEAGAWARGMIDARVLDDKPARIDG
ncbi:MAG: hypothetical protein IBX58_01795 [Roseovarius sp.]|nr:hypothetical protein [Roseovarius sp.]